jgi:hypothetical protein
MLLIIDLDDTPWVRPPANLTAAWRQDDRIRADNGERNFARDFLRFIYGLFIFVLICGRLEDLDIMIRYIRKNLGFK